MNKEKWLDLRDRLIGGVQLALPTNALSSAMFHLTRIRTPWFKNAFIRVFMKLFRISLDEAYIEDPRRFEHFNAFFTRELKRGARQVAADPRICLCPVDGTVSQIGDIRDGRIVQAKGLDYTAAELLGSEEAAAQFRGGRFATIYLAPYNYHRIHMPADGTLREWSYVPGRLFSVNAATVRGLPRVFARNERLCAIFDTAHGPVAMVLVGALFVGSLETVWSGCVSPPHGQAPGQYVPRSPVQLGRGVEMGRFNMGSTVILLTAPGAVNWSPTMRPGATVRMGQTLGIFNARS
ncbi:MAG: phosphatidylserine decarboxylase [Gammaproteobacteria bacterium]|nr:phosphatidylserine decarboxylase [Gammaproteobacteria bacterium]